jgi:epoxyqueuosine reductase QueG
VKQDASQTRNMQSATRSGLIARYARFEDYHDIIGERAKLLANFVTSLGGEGTKSLWYVDTGPFLERDIAQRAGIGFVGKHTNLISRRLGNWIFLAEIISTLEIEPDAPEKNHCGTCAPVHFVSHDRIEGRDPRGIPARDRESDLWLRRLPRGMSLEPLRP